MLLFESDKHTEFAQGAVMIKVAPKSERTSFQFPTSGTAAVREQAPLQLSADRLMHAWSMDSQMVEAELRIQREDTRANCPPEVYIG